ASLRTFYLSGYPDIPPRGPQCCYVDRSMFDRAAFAFLAVLFLATSCTKRNPDYCDAELPCAEPDRPVCLIEEGDDSGLCVAATCSRSADCSAESPICEGSCRGCQSDIECMALDATAPMCAEGKCVQCITAAD